MFLQIFLKKLNLWPKMQVFFLQVENTTTWSHFGDMNLSRKTYVLLWDFLLYDLFISILSAKMIHDFTKIVYIAS